jgi:ComEC/Rec2-related protein
MIATLGLLAFFALLTRFEPSVVRASAMAGVSVLAMTAGLPVSGVRVLALAVIGVLLVDPLLVGVLGFQLSVLASLAIIVAAPVLTDRLPGPAWLRDPLAVTLAAQAGVAPVLISAFGGIPLASVPANLLAGPAAGPLMVHGLVGGVVAGVAAAVGADGLAAVIHLPTRALLWWVTVVARTGADVGLGELGGPGVLVVTGAVSLVVWLAGRGASTTRRLLGGVAAGVIIAAIAPAALQPWRPPVLEPNERFELTTGAVLWTSATGRPAVLVLDGRVQVGRLLTEARRRRIRDVPVLIAATSSPVLANAIGPVARRLDPTSVLVPPAVAPLIDGSVVPVDGTAVRLDGFAARVHVAPERVVLEAGAD